jgi:hypothetical protein
VKSQQWNLKQGKVIVSVCEDWLMLSFKLDRKLHWNFLSPEKFKAVMYEAEA